MSVSVNLNKANGTNFRLVFPVLPTETLFSANKELTINIFNIIIPSISLDQSEQRWQGNKVNYHSGNMNFDVWNVQFIVDSEFKNWKLLYKWLTFIANNKDKPSSNIPDYFIDTVLKITDNYGDPALMMIFRNTWIQSLGEVNLSQREGESTLECNATFVYDRIELLDDF